MALDLQPLQTSGGVLDLQPLDPSANHLGAKSKPVLGEDLSRRQRRKQEGKLLRQRAGKAAKAVGGFALGAGKGLLSTLEGGSSLIQRGGTALGGGLAGLLPGREGFRAGRQEALSSLETSGTAAEQIIPEQARTATTGAQKAGFAVEQFGEFLLPGAQAVKGAKALQLAQKSPKLAGLARGAGKVAKEAATFGGITATQQGELGPEALQAAAIGGALPIVGQAAKAVKPFITKTLPSRFINSIIKPATKEFKFGKNPGLAVAREGIKANNIEGLAKGITAKKREIGKKLGDTVAKFKTKSNVQGTIDDILTKEVPKVTDQNALNQMNNALQQIFNVTKVEGGKVVNVGRRNLVDMTPTELHKLQQKVGQLAQFTGNPAEKPVNQLLGKMYTALGKQLDKAAPGAKKLQSRFANLLGAEKAVQNRVAQETRNNLIGLRQAGVGGLAGAGEFARTGDISDALVIGALTSLGLRGIQSTALRSRAAIPLARLGQKQIGAGVGRVGKAAVAKVPTARPPAPQNGLQIGGAIPPTQLAF